MKKYNIAVVPGRFEPLHKGHIPLFKKAYEVADHVVCAIGSANMPRTPINPFTASERRDMIAASLAVEGIERPFFVDVEDTIYLNQRWFRRLKDRVKYITRHIAMEQEEETAERLAQIETELSQDHDINVEFPNEGTLHIHLHGEHTSAAKLIKEHRSLLASSKLSIAIVGHQKDKSTEYLAEIPDWDLVDEGAFVSEYRHDKPISATQIRELWFTGKLSFARPNLPTPVYDFIEGFDDATFLRLQGEYEWVVDYKAKNQKNEYETQFITSDAVVMHGDEVLTVIRGEYPGIGLRALPGGFKQSTENFLDGCMRELTEETVIKVPEKVLRGSVTEAEVFDHPDRSSRGTTVTKAHLIILDPKLPRPKVKGRDDARLAEWIPLADFFKMRNELFEDHYDIVEFMTSRI